MNSRAGWMHGAKVWIRVMSDHNREFDSGCWPAKLVVRSSIAAVVKADIGRLPHLSHDTLVAGAHLVLALLTIVSHNIDPLETAVVTVGAFTAGKARNVIPDTATLGPECPLLHAGGARS